MQSRINSLASEHLSAMLGIEQTAHQYPWCEAQLRACLQAPYLSWQLCIDEVLCGYACFHGVIPEVELVNIAIMPARQGQGLGQHLLQACLTELAGQGFREAFLEVRASNQAAQALYHRLGFQYSHTRKDYYRSANGREDALCFVKTNLSDL